MRRFVGQEMLRTTQSSCSGRSGQQSLSNSCMCRVAKGASNTGAVSSRVKIRWPAAARESRPSSDDLSRIVSTPMTSTTSCAPLATAIAPTRNASEPDGHAFSIRVHGMPFRPIAAGTVLPPMPPAPTTCRVGLRRRQPRPPEARIPCRRSRETVGRSPFFDPHSAGDERAANSTRLTSDADELHAQAVRGTGHLMHGIHLVSLNDESIILASARARHRESR